MENNTEIRTDLLARIANIGPVINNNAKEAELNRRLSDETFNAMENKGLFKVLVPKRYGGYQTDTRTLMEGAIALSEYDGSASWVYTIINICNWLGGLLSEEAQNEIWGVNPNAKISGCFPPTSTAIKVEGGYRVTGKWYYNSGGLHTDWCVLGIPLSNESNQIVGHGLAFIAEENITREDTWYVTGLKGTGSGCVIVNDLFVPDHRVLDVGAAGMGKVATEYYGQEALYRSSIVPILAVILAAPIIGLGKAAFKYVQEKAHIKGVTYTTIDKQADSVHCQVDLAKAKCLLDEAHYFAFRTADEIDELADKSIVPDFATRVRHRADTGYSAKLAIDAMDMLLYIHGAGSFAESNPLQKMWRDANTGARHGFVSPMMSMELYGKSLLGMNEITVSTLV